MYDGDPPLGGVGTSCTTSRKYMMFGLGLGQKKKGKNLGVSKRNSLPLSIAVIHVCIANMCSRSQIEV